ncbi:hypothetical protein PLICRDRAFT_180562 [Plicaturopsis crispa FD-325 SS-3]|uniref:Uncharacterized protein n=1 Tax=Plicaturopsis crispa FD-325 SS-3 TaxID=944288 RepID=A0A0C9SVX1_PLICR|nr:hypothetical protein PLICRDRAFT_180562 [Plicaturopsis crispa FD-325 SS-3]
MADYTMLLESVFDFPLVKHFLRENDAKSPNIFPRAVWDLDLPLCAMCVKLSAPDLTDDERLHLEKSLKQCGQCGLVGTRIVDPCGTCKRAETSEKGTNDAERLAAANARQQKAQGFFGSRSKPVNVAGTTASQIGASTAHGELEAIRANTSSRAFTVIFEVRNSLKPNAIDKRYGTGHESFEPNTPMIVLEVLVASINRQWISTHASDLKVEHTQLRFRNNVNLLNNTEALDIKAFYERYARLPNRDVYLPTLKGYVKGTHLCMEVYIDQSKFDRSISGFHDDDENDDNDSDLEGWSQGSKRRKTRKGTTPRKRGRKERPVNVNSARLQK